MSRLFVIDENLKKKLLERLQTQPDFADVGLLIGQTLENKELIVTFVPTPVEEESTQKKETSNHIFDKIENQWIKAHANKVREMLVGGFDVLAVYVSANSQAELKKREAQIGLFAKNVRADSKISINITPESWTASSSPTAGTKPANIDLKFSNIIGEFHKFDAKYSFDESVPESKDSVHKSLTNLLENSHFSEEIKSMVGVVNNNFSIRNEQTLEEILKQENNHTVQFYVPNQNNKNESACGIKLKGTITASAYVHNKQTIGKAIQILKQDIVSSLRNRISTYLDEAEDKNFQSKESELRKKKQIQFKLSQRLFISDIVSKMMLFTDYPMDVVEKDELGERINEFLNFPDPANATFKWEFDPKTQNSNNNNKKQTNTTNTTTNTNTNVGKGNKNTETQTIQQTQPTNFILIALVVLLIGVLAAFFLRN